MRYDGKGNEEIDGIKIGEISIPFSTFADKADRIRRERQTDEPLNPPHF